MMEIVELLENRDHQSDTPSSIVLFKAVDDAGEQYAVACDHRAAADIYAHLNLWKQNMVEDPPFVDPPAWAMWRIR